MGIMLLQIQLVIIRILSLAEMVGLPNIQIMQVIINVQILAAHTIQDRLVAHTHSVTVDKSGEGKSHNTMQPYLSCYMWRRTV